MHFYNDRLTIYKMLKFHTYMNYLFLNRQRWPRRSFIFIMAFHQTNIGTSCLLYTSRCV
ncbi:hypothetical protein [Klebsiella pneumoniae]|uniref:hypothetical protein n=1 Tax=Klebsiella pneumoniae TaxID=573 RepID=UPI0015C4F0C2|nr:hypothetical protein [Klebsiella pneumoniae]